MQYPRRNASTARFGALFFIAILICVILNPLNSSTISVALPILLHALHTNSSGIPWIVSAYYLGSAIAQPIMGKLGDAWGPSRFVYGGLSLMIVTAILAPLSNTLALFVFWRVVQAVGTSMIYPNAIGLLRQHRPGDIGKALGWIGMAGGIAVAVGPTVGGFLVDNLSWHAVFWLNIPLSIVAMVLLWRLLPMDSRRADQASVHTSPLRNLDWGGMLLFSGAVTAGLIGSSAELTVLPGPVWMALGLLLAIGLVVVELHHPSPVVPVRWFRRRQFSLASMMTVLVNLVMYCILYGLPVALETVRHFSATDSGLVLLAFAGVMSLASPLGGRYAQSVRRRSPVMASGVLLSAGTLLLIWINRLPIWLVIVGLALIGVSFAISNVVIQQMVLESVPNEATGQASGVYTLLRYVGTMASSVLIGGSLNGIGGASPLYILLTVASGLTILMSTGIQDRRTASSA